jgi:dCTP deaminase
MLFPRQLDDGTGEPLNGKAPSTGVLPYQTIVQMVTRTKELMATADVEPSQIQPASIDLRLGRFAYPVRASFLPGRTSVLEKVKGQMDGEPALDLSGGAVLQKGSVYVIELLEHVRLPGTVTGYSNPKSSTGRLDILTRLITDNGTAFDQIEPGYEGKLYVEVAPQTFNVIVRRGSRLNQLRFQRGHPSITGGNLAHLYDSGQLVRGGSEPRLPLQDNLVPVTVDLRGVGRGGIIGYRAKKHTRKIDIDLVAAYDPDDFWERLLHRDEGTLILDPDEFYILATREEVGVPPSLAAEMVPYYTQSGEYRVHYAGFFDPGFGWKDRAEGSRAVLEVRSHEVPFLLEHGQTVGWLRYVRMAAAPTKVYGAGVTSNYQGQGLTLAKQFRAAS